MTWFLHGVGVRLGWFVGDILIALYVIALFLLVILVVSWVEGRKRKGVK